MLWTLVSSSREDHDAFHAMVDIYKELDNLSKSVFDPRLPEFPLPIAADIFLITCRCKSPSPIQFDIYNYSSNVRNEENALEWWQIDDQE